MSVHTESGPKPENQPKPFRKWQCGTPYEYPITPEGRDYWEELLEPLLEEDKAQCDSWKDEVGNLLLFAGLFSAVVTAFVIVSYTSLQPDQGEITNTLLARIADRLDNPLNRSSSPAMPVNTVSLASSPNSSSIRINIYWSISLVLSLTTALMGIVAVQWLKQHQTYPASYSSMQKFATFNMRAEGLRAWYVPQIFSALPLLLQAALALFFVGLIEFLLNSSSTVAIPVIIFTGFPLSFLVITTTIPALQVYAFCLPQCGPASIPSQAPYKSTQSRLVLHLLGWSERCSNVFFYFGYVVNYHILSLPYRLYQFVKTRLKGPREAEVEDSLTSEQVYYNLWTLRNAMTQPSWTTFDDEWLTLRNALSVSIFDGASSMRPFHHSMTANSAPFFDLANGLLMSLSSHQAKSEEVLGVGCGAVREMTAVINENCTRSGVDARAQYTRHLQGLLALRPSSTYSSFLNPSAGFMEDETKFVLLSRYVDLPPVTLRHFVELHVRIANYLYPSESFPSIQRDLLSEPPTFPNMHFSFYYNSEGNAPEVVRRATYALEGATGNQLSSLIKTAFEVVADPEVNFDAILASSYGHPTFSVFAYAIVAQSPEQVSSTLNTILSKIQGSTERIMDRRSDFLFYLSSFCVRMNLLRFPSYYNRPELLNYVEQPDPKFDDVLAALRQYLEARKAPDEDLRKTMDIPDLDQAWWSFLNINRDKEDEEAVDSLPEIPGKPPSSSSIIENSPQPAVLQEDCKGALDDMPSTNVDASYLV